ncbi:MAG: Rne/Rng family ribonuclease [Victivallaceae bacterium]|nr:Rne/Rng family ribonuclease [Victivallaceae bacterium]
MDTAKKRIILSCETLETRFALLNHGKLEEYEIERASNGPKAGSVYLGKIVNLEPSLHAAFVDIGMDKNAFLHYWDMLPATFDLKDKIVENAPENKTGDNKKKTRFSEQLNSLLKQGGKSHQIREKNRKRQVQQFTVKDIPALFPPGTELLVQVVKEPIGTKAARLTTNISIPGRYLVLLPYSEHFALSSKIESKAERSRLKKIISELDVPKGMGVICRTVGEGRKAVFFKRDLDMLLDYWRKVEEILEKHQRPTEVYREPNLIERTVRDLMTDDIDEIQVDNEEAYNQIRNLLYKFGGRKMSAKVACYRRARPIFEHFDIKNQINQIFTREVPLPSGGGVCIDETEALIAIDVNTGKGKGKRVGEQPEVILQTNIEAAEEIARQLRLRNVGGLVVIDFIDMRSSRDRETIFKLMRKLVKNDRAKSTILPLSRLGLMEMTRQREHESLRNTVLDRCPYCNGTGHVKSSLSMSVEIQRRLHSLFKSRGSKAVPVRIFMHPDVLTRLKNEDAELFVSLERQYGRDLSFRADSTMHHEEFKLVDPETGRILEHASDH